jgi:hypothetical protein
MSAISSSARAQIIGSIGIAAAFLMLLVGSLSVGAGHGSYTMWYAGLVTLSVSAPILFAGMVAAALSHRYRELLYGLLVIFFFSMVWIFHTEIAGWFTLERVRLLPLDSALL